MAPWGGGRDGRQTITAHWPRPATRIIVAAFAQRPVDAFRNFQAQSPAAPPVFRLENFPAPSDFYPARKFSRPQPIDQIFHCQIDIDDGRPLPVSRSGRLRTTNGRLLDHIVGLSDAAR
jgi:hypothetical protein